KLVNIMSLSGTQLKKEPLVGKGSKFVVRTGTCSLLYILGLTGFTVDMNDLKMYKNSAFYTYANPYKKSPICEKYDKPTPKYP
ncbi:hypothetical protein, partial [Priestia megaterium]|uniref:hypothetical protein n=1 Tax=Priestia megaterium TaxID=1404 RepID=UPI002E1E643B|nr:hypothetical protein [Priestia megaterium]